MGNIIQVCKNLGIYIYIYIYISIHSSPRPVFVAHKSKFKFTGSLYILNGQFCIVIEGLLSLLVAIGYMLATIYWVFECFAFTMQNKAIIFF